MLSRFRMIVGRHCRSMGLVIHARPLVPGGEMTRQQAFHLQEMERHTMLNKVNHKGGNMARDQGAYHRTQADRATDPREQAKHLRAASLKGEVAPMYYLRAQIHKAEATQHREALRRLSNSNAVALPNNRRSSLSLHGTCCSCTPTSSWWGNDIATGFSPSTNEKTY